MKKNEHLEKKANGWVFLSHSSEDYQDVKIVRDYLERRGFSAIMFYLKSLEDPKHQKLTQKLIEWEIEARNIFVLCNSNNAQKSDWVQKEVALVESFPEKIYETIDMENIKYNRYRKDKELSKLKSLISKNSLFFSYVKKDEEQVESISIFLNEYGFQIFKEKDTNEKEDNISFRIKNAIETTINEGAVLIFLSSNVIDSKQFWMEKNIALNLTTFIIPILLDDVPLSCFSAFANFDDSKYVDVKDGFNDEEKMKLIQLIKEGKE